MDPNGSTIPISDGSNTLHIREKEGRPPTRATTNRTENNTVARETGGKMTDVFVESPENPYEGVAHDTTENNVVEETKKE